MMMKNANIQIFNERPKGYDLLYEKGSRIIGTAQQLIKKQIGRKKAQIRIFSNRLELKNFSSVCFFLK